MNTHDRQSLDDQQLDGSKKFTKTPGTRPDKIEDSIRDLQAAAGNRAVSDLVAGSGPALQGSFFGGALGGLEDWMAKESSGVRPGFDASMKEESGDASMKDEAADASMKDQSADASMKEESADASMKEESVDASMKEESVDASMKDEAGDASMKEEPVDASMKDESGDAWP